MDYDKTGSRGHTAVQKDKIEQERPKEISNTSCRPILIEKKPQPNHQ